MDRCGRCGKELDVTAAFCPACGTAVGTWAEKTQFAGEGLPQRLTGAALVFVGLVLPTVADGLSLLLGPVGPVTVLAVMPLICVCAALVAGFGLTSGRLSAAVLASELVGAITTLVLFVTVALFVIVDGASSSQLGVGPIAGSIGSALIITSSIRSLRRRRLVGSGDQPTTDWVVFSMITAIFVQHGVLANLAVDPSANLWPDLGLLLLTALVVAASLISGTELIRQAASTRGREARLLKVAAGLITLLALPRIMARYDQNLAASTHAVTTISRTFELFLALGGFALAIASAMWAIRLGAYLVYRAKRMSSSIVVVGPISNAVDHD